MPTQVAFSQERRFEELDTDRATGSTTPSMPIRRTVALLCCQVISRSTAAS